MNVASPWEPAGDPGALGKELSRPKRAPIRPLRYLYMLPMLLLVGAFLLYPAFTTAWLSFTDSNGLNNPKFIGLKNYTNLFTDPAFSTSFTNTLLWVVGVLILQVSFGLLIALVLSGVRGGNALKILFYLPATISGASVAVVWYFMFDPNQGMINTTLRLLHLGGLAQDW
ncbi:MAG TPA: sugar ABC transporter permease, partial [Chloroflexota bacterium]|nr:sugar ABC transporter permease [Chloroflexota bacterium]